MSGPGSQARRCQPLTPGGSKLHSRVCEGRPWSSLLPMIRSLRTNGWARALRRERGKVEQGGLVAMRTPPQALPMKVWTKAAAEGHRLTSRVWASGPV